MSEERETFQIATKNFAWLITIGAGADVGIMAWAIEHHRPDIFVKSMGLAGIIGLIAIIGCVAELSASAIKDRKKSNRK